MPTFVENLGDKYNGLYKFARCRDLTYSILICAVLMASASLTSPHRRSTSCSSWLGNTWARTTRAAQHPCVFPSSLLLRRPPSSAQLTATVQIVAGIISLLNDYPLSKGKPPLGFLNPWLYGETASRASTTLLPARAWDVGLTDSPLSPDGILCAPPDLCLFIFYVG